MRRAVAAVAGSLLILSCTGLSRPGGDRTARETARSIVGRVVRETAFELRSVPQKPVLGIQVVDFGALFGRGRDGIVCAVRTVHSVRDTVLAFGLSRDLPLEIVLNGSPVYSAHAASQFLLKEIAYDIFRFNDTISLRLKRGENRILIKGELSSGSNTVALRELTEPGVIQTAEFSSGGNGWKFIGPFGDETLRPGRICAPDSPGAGETFTWRGTVYRWTSPAPAMLQEFSIKADAAYRRESYAEWQYPSGILMLSILDYASVAQDTSLTGFVRQFCNFTLRNESLFRKQYEEQHAYRGANHRFFRRAMLDDTGAPALPFVEMLLREGEKRFQPVVTEIANTIMRDQLRREDGTLCRYEPSYGSVWSDDLFMSVPYLVRMGRLTGDTAYVDEAARQALQFNKYLLDRKTGLYRHGWFGSEKRQSPIAWGRSNGWVVWAMSELLASLPPSHPLSDTLRAIFRNHMESIVRYQAPSGLWHQVLDGPQSFEETSCSAMFLIGLSRALRLGIIDSSHFGNVKKAWAGLQSNIGDDGIVRDICRGTSIGESFEFYERRERFPNDPRGLGAVIEACVEMERIAATDGR